MRTESIGPTDFLLSHHQRRVFECIQVRNVIAYAVMLTVHIRKFCQVSPGPLPRSACGPGYEAIFREIASGAPNWA